MMQERLTTGKGDTAVGAPVVVVATQRVDKIGYRHNANGLLKSTGSARRGALDGLAVVADFPVYARLSVLVKLNRSVGACIPACSAALIPLAHAVSKHELELGAPALRIGAPTALQGASRKEHVSAAAGTIVHRITLNIKNHACGLGAHGPSDHVVGIEKSRPARR